jgi:hypothetical protein
MTLKKVEHTLGRIEEKLDNVEDTFKQHIQDDRDQFKNINGTLLKIKQKIWIATGIMIGAVAVSNGALLEILKFIIK